MLVDVDDRHGDSIGEDNHMLTSADLHRDTSLPSSLLYSWKRGRQYQNQLSTNVQDILVEGSGVERLVDSSKIH